MQIRKMRIEDYENVRRLWMSTPGMGLNDVDDSEAGIGRFLMRNPNTCFIAVNGDEVAGVILSGHDGRRGYVYHTAVAAKERNRGIGSALVQKAMDALENEGISKVALVVFDRNETGNKFWEKRGFTVRNDLVYRNKAVKEMVRIDT
ncbi:ribosomal protein S18 acetylase RimI-like enzyme [Hungatella effluvii]|uniref:Ribosomal protein S18 acetylase RimI-like enzyme n=1 Tax=Hungatella effluvii TaxID=1096246 RepID=A0A2V3XW79_9FIRM|nr:GNAT family N-acetyltransferase [Hungatella effluvii]PXX46097.1 ribosomal protein S18 acetylase RimI-like enzyme [Hungatella effluvii]